MSDFWAVGNRPYPEKIYMSMFGNLLIFDDEKRAKQAAEDYRVRGHPAVVFPIEIYVPDNHVDFINEQVKRMHEIDEMR